MCIFIPRVLSDKRIYILSDQKCFLVVVVFYEVFKLQLQYGSPRACISSPWPALLDTLQSMGDGQRRPRLDRRHHGVRHSPQQLYRPCSCRRGGRRATQSHLNFEYVDFISFTSATKSIFINGTS